MEERKRCFTFVIYPDEKNFLDIMEEVINQNTAFILHDKDIDDDGNLKKSHYHVCVKFKDAKTCSSVAKLFCLKNEKGEIAPNRVEVCSKGKKNFKGALLYLTHANAPDKYQYSVSDIQGKLKDTVKSLVTSGSDTERSMSLLFNYIMDSESFLRFIDISLFASSNNCLCTLSSKSYYFKLIIDEHNKDLLCSAKDKKS